MSSQPRKRLREGQAVTAISSTPPVDDTPLNWRLAAASAGVSGADAFLLHLGRSIAAALQSIREASEDARVQLRELRSTVISAIGARFDELNARIDSADASKTASLEREFVAVDAALERWRAASGAPLDAVSALTIQVPSTHHAALSCRLDDMKAQLQALPTAVVEPPFVALLADTPALLSSIADFGRVLAPLPLLQPT